MFPSFVTVTWGSHVLTSPPPDEKTGTSVVNFLTVGVEEEEKVEEEEEEDNRIQKALTIVHKMLNDEKAMIKD
jgi:hypothetical protein